MFVTTFLLFFIFNSYTCFNLDVNSPIVYSDPLPNVSSGKSSYFGYSLVLYPGSETDDSWVLIGAPRGNLEGISVNPGVGFKCGIKKKCAILVSLTIDDRSFPKNDSWIGGSMDIDNAHNRIVICAPRQIYDNYDKKHDKRYYYLNGMCYLLHTNDSSVKRLFPISDLGDIVNSNSAMYNAAYGQAGFSVHFPNLEESELLLGAPGVLNWKGTSVLQKDSSSEVPIASRLVRQKRNINEFGADIIASAGNNEDYGLLGYSSTSGYFFDKQVLHYVSGAPRAYDYRGQIFVYTFNEPNNPTNIRDSPHGVQFGEYFGASLTAGDLNNDGFDDLVIGAPFYVAKKYNEGRVYFFMGGTRVNFLNPSHTLEGQAINGQFGSCVQFLGDINDDGFGDIAIAAPYEEDSGVVYVYATSKSGLSGHYQQRIVGKDISTAIRGFGISISRGADIDQNKYSDVAIGAYLSGHVVLLRASPVVSVVHHLESLVSNLNPDQTEFRMRACYFFVNKKSKFNIAIQRTVTVDSQFGRAKLKNADSVSTLTLEKDKQFCEDLTLTLEKSSNTFDPIVVTLSHEFVNDQPKKGVVYVNGNGVVGEDYFCKNCPVYNGEQSSKLQKVEIPFALGCGPDNICTANLQFESKVDGIGKDNIFVVGSKDHLTLETVVTNLGERAYLTQLLVVLPETVHLYNTPSSCVQNGSSVICSVDSRLEQNVKKLVHLSLDMTNVNEGGYDGDALDFTIKVLTSSNNTNDDDVKKLRIKLKREADVTISGKSEEQSYFYGGVQKPINFVQTYQVEKFGMSVLNEILVEINIPRSINTEKGTASNFISLESITGKLDGQEFMCSESNVDTYKTGNDQFFISSVKDISNNSSGKDDHSFYVNCNMPEVECSKLTCSAGPIASGQIATIKLKLMFNISVVRDLLNTNDVIYFRTRGLVKVKNPHDFVQNGDKPDMVDIVSMFVGEGVKEKVAVWIIVLSVIASLILLALFIYILYRLGFFRRKVKEELQQIKNEMDLNETDTLQEE